MKILFTLMKIDYVINMPATSFFPIQIVYITELSVAQGSLYRRHRQEVKEMIGILLNVTFSFLVEARIC